MAVGLTFPALLHACTGPRAANCLRDVASVEVWCVRVRRNPGLRTFGLRHEPQAGDRLLEAITDSEDAAA